MRHSPVLFALTTASAWATSAEDDALLEDNNRKLVFLVIFLIAMIVTWFASRKKGSAR